MGSVIAATSGMRHLRQVTSSMTPLYESQEKADLIDGDRRRNNVVLEKAKASPTGLGPPEGASHGTFPSVTLSTGTGSAGLTPLNVPWRPGDRELAGGPGSAEAGLRSRLHSPNTQLCIVAGDMARTLLTDVIANFVWLTSSSIYQKQQQLNGRGFEIKMPLLTETALSIFRKLSLTTPCPRLEPSCPTVRKKPSWRGHDEESLGSPAGVPADGQRLQPAVERTLLDAPAQSAPGGLQPS
uniref:Uncharacterized protein n=1 Tax=Rangifer tarandus platyrhynchus TaxID=3082113 RepID=A0ACB0ERC0_RANTA|nr:unnamed protein product [Rangifer tarandus platyrhynchus]